MNRYHMLTLLSVAAVLLILLVPSVDGAGQESEKPWDRYPYADYIITTDKDGSAVLSY